MPVGIPAALALNGPEDRKITSQLVIGVYTGSGSKNRACSAI